MANQEPAGGTNVLELPSLLYQLCSKITGDRLNSDDVSRLYQLAFHFLGQPQTPMGDNEEFYLLSKIQERLSGAQRHTDALRLHELYYQLKRSPQSCRNPIAFLEFLYRLSAEPGNSHDKSNDSLHLLNNSLSPVAMKSKTVAAANGQLKMTSERPSSAYDLARLLPTLPADGTQLNHFVNITGARPRTRPTGQKPLARPHTIHVDGTSGHQLVTEQELLREVLFAFQGLNGKILCANPAGDDSNIKFTVNSPYFIPAPAKKLALRLCNLGWLFNKVNMYCQYTVKDPAHGHVTQSFASALHDEILEFYRLVTTIEEQLHADQTGDSDVEAPRVTLNRVEVWAMDEFYQMKMLANLVEECRHRRGGALAGIVYRKMQHGDVRIRNCLTRILNEVVFPIRRMLSQWIFHGEVEDPYREFFITSNHSRPDAPASPSFWHDKHVINQEMLPGFITRDQAGMILATGKATFMLRKVCGNEITASVDGYDELKASFESTDLESLFKKKPSTGQDDAGFQSLLERAYQDITKMSLKILYDNFKLMWHFRGLRQYMLLGQGDFIRHLMDVLSKQLDKPADKLARHTLVPLLEAAIRATNAQYDDQDVLSRVDVRLVESSINETGWDVFTLAYRVDGPIGTVLNNDSQKMYLKLFKHLWRSKRMEHILANIWRDQMAIAKTRKITELRGAFHSFNVLMSEMIHFVQQMNYYFTFDVIECQWVQLQAELDDPKDLDTLIQAHFQFLDQVIQRSFLNQEAQELADQYRAICDNILDFQKHFANIWKATESEINKRDEYEEDQDPKDKKAGRRRTLDQYEIERRAVFVNDTIPKAKTKVVLLTRTFQDMVQKFLVMLADHPQRELQELSSRLDFNENYKKRDKRLETSFTFGSHKQRLSIDAQSTPESRSQKSKS